MLHVSVDRYHTTNRTATTNGPRPISLACAAGLGKYGYGNGFTERISGTVLVKALKRLNFQDANKTKVMRREKNPKKCSVSRASIL